MSAENLDNPVYYQQLDDLEYEFEQVELEILRQQHKMTRELYPKRDQLIAQIPNFWPLVFEHAPPEIDEYIQPNDAAVIVGALKNVSVERFELPDGHPRSFSIKFDFSENEYFEDKTIEKKFWWRVAKDGWGGFVSEPVEIKWKEGKDLTDGLLTLAKKVFEDDKAGKLGENTDNKKELLKKLESSSLDSASFFNFFGFRGRYITEEESKEAIKLEEEQRQARKDGKDVEEDDMDEDDEDDGEYEFEIFPNGDEFGLAIAEDLWPDAIRYFREGEEIAALSDMDFEDEDDEDDEEGEDEDEEMGEGGDEKPSKKRKA